MQKINNLKNTLLTIFLLMTGKLIFGQEKEIKPPNFSVGAFYSRDFHYNRTDAVQGDLGYKWGFSTSKFLTSHLYISLALGKQQLGFKSVIYDSLYFLGMDYTTDNLGNFYYSKCYNCSYEFLYRETIIPVFLGYYIGKRKIKLNVEIGSIFDCFLKTRFRVLFSDGQYYEKKAKNNLLFLDLASNLNLSYFLFNNFVINTGIGIRFHPIKPSIFTAYSAHINLNYIFRKK